MRTETGRILGPILDWLGEPRIGIFPLAAIIYWTSRISFELGADNPEDAGDKIYAVTMTAVVLAVVAAIGFAWNLLWAIIGDGAAGASALWGRYQARKTGDTHASDS